jgi:hypothetical protein
MGMVLSLVKMVSSIMTTKGGYRMDIF